MPSLPKQSVPNCLDTCLTDLSMTIFFYFIISGLITMVLIPPLNKYSGYLKMLDSPGERKIHKSAKARVGGVAMVAGAIIPIIC